ncbi:MAG TPA: DUF362 domain-containing protein [bacterium]|nr:DUF362 domain-containing protein [bacterium]
MAKVYFLPVEKINQLETFLVKAGLPEIFSPGDNVALKIHFGSSGHDHHVLPELVAPIVSLVRSRKASPFLTDTNVLYRGERDTTFSHLEVAWSHGYHHLAPIVIAGSFRGDDEVVVRLPGENKRPAYLAREFSHFKALVAVTHFKGHLLSGIGGTIKNIGMGCASRKGKFAMHASVQPQVTLAQCTGCGRCVQNCPAQAITLVKKKASIDRDRCFGCAQCVHVCPEEAIDIPWSSTSSVQFQERLAFYAAAVHSLYPEKFFAVNFLLKIAPNCDCLRNPGEPMVPDIGVLASSDPVAIDQASVYLVKETPGAKWGAGVDKFQQVWPACPYWKQLEAAEKLGLGSRQFQIESF